MKNSNLTVVIARGLPASGKTTFARQWVSEDKENRVRVEKDEIRKDGRLFKDGEYSHKRGDESIVIKERDRLIKQALSQGKSVVSSDTNLVQKHVTRITNIAKEHGAEVVIESFLDVPLAEVIERDKNREDSVGEQVIRRMFHESVKTLPTFLSYDPSLKWLVVSDLDGSLTNGPKNRSPYEWHKVGNDEINLGVAALLDGVQFIHGKRGVDDVDLFIFSGRDAVCRPETEAWLEKNDIEYDKLVMRAENDNRNDAIVKGEFIEEHIRGKYNVLFWIDDRPRVADHLRDYYGINVLQRGDVRYEF